MKFIKYPLIESHKPLHTVFFNENGKACIEFEKEIYVDGSTGELRKALVYETDDKKMIAMLEAHEKEISKMLTKKKKASLRKRMLKFKGKDNATGITEEQIARVNIVCKYGRGEAKKPEEKRQLEKPVKAVQ